MKDLTQYLHFYIGCKGIVNATPYHHGVGKNNPLESTPVLFDSINRSDAQWVGVTYTGELGLEFYDVFDKYARIYYEHVKPEHFKPILRPHPRFHGGMTSEEAVEIYDTLWPDRIKDSVRCKENTILLHFDRINITYELIPELLNRHFDLFGLIDAGLAIALSK